jgi:hypothetical protein
LLLERELQEKLGTNVRIEKKENGGKVLIDFYSVEDLAHIRDMISRIQHQVMVSPSQAQDSSIGPMPEAQPEEIPEKSQDDDLYSISNFSV